MSNELKGYLLGFVGVVIFGLTLPATRIAVASLDPVFVGLGRAALAAAIGASFLLIMRQRWPAGREWGKLVAVAGGVVIGFPLLSAIAMQTAPAAHGGVVLGTLPLATAITAALFTGERPSAGFWACSIVGAAAVVAFALIDGGAELHAADTLLVLSVISAAVGYAIGGDLTRSLGGWQVISWALIVSLPVTIPAALLTMPNTLELYYVTPRMWWAFLYVAVFSQFLGFFAWNAGLALGGIAKVGQVQLLQTFVTLAGAAVLVGEQIDATTIGFAVFVVAVVALSRKMQVARAEPQAPEKTQTQPIQSSGPEKLSADPWSRLNYGVYLSTFTVVTVIWLVGKFAVLFLIALGNNGCTRCESGIGSWSQAISDALLLGGIEAAVSAVILAMAFGLVAKRRKALTLPIRPVFIPPLIYVVPFMLFWIEVVFLSARCGNDCSDIPYYPVVETLLIFFWIASSVIFAGATVWSMSGTSYRGVRSAPPPRSA